MKFAIFATAAVFASAPLAAQTMPTPAATSMPMKAPAAAAPAMTAATTTAPAGKFSLDTPIEAIAADPAGKAVLDKDFPGMLAHPMYDSFKSMSLSQVQPMSQGAITDAQLAAAKADLAAVK